MDKNRLVLVVEDDADIRESVSEVLRDHGLEVVEACNGAEALAELERRQESACTIVLDVMMPVMDGVEFLQKLRERQAKHKVIVASAHQSRSDQLQALEVTASLRKPYNLSDLLRWVI